MPMIPCEDVVALATALNDLLHVPLPAPVPDDRMAYQVEVVVRIAHVRAWCDAFATSSRVSVGDFTSALAGLAAQREALPYRTQAQWRDIEARLAEQDHQLLDPAVPPLAVAAAGGAW